MAIAVLYASPCATKEIVQRFMSMLAAILSIPCCDNARARDINVDLGRTAWFSEYMREALGAERASLVMVPTATTGSELDHIFVRGNRHFIPHTYA